MLADKAAVPLAAAAAVAAASAAATGQLDHSYFCLFLWYLLLSEFFSILLKFSFLTPFPLALAATAETAGARGLMRRVMYSLSWRCTTLNLAK